MLIATHVDARHIHSHFLVNAVCYESGRMLRQGPRTLEHLRRISDELCIRHGLSVLNNADRKQTAGISAREYRAAEKGQSWKFELMNVIDDCMRRSKTQREFQEQMRRRGYGVRWTRERKSITYTTPTGMKCRDYRLHEKRYLKEAMEREFRIRAEIFYGRIETEEPAGEYDRADAGNTSDRGGMGGADRAAGTAGNRSGESPESTVRMGGAGAGGDEDADQYADGRGSGAADGAPTGWEEERAALLTETVSQNQTAPSDTRMAAANPGGGAAGAGVVGDVVQLGKALERLLADGPVTDATTRPLNGDRKPLRREQEKKIAMGHKEDDHEEPREDYQQHLY
ncbi:MAG: relaxase/mobilization nuclease domain-containing protein [Oscillospiraceae bacterium]|nr:relaxase/mobilization nuclease domain-containing protein [Oscillospiraceae bacterium]